MSTLASRARQARAVAGFAGRLYGERALTWRNGYLRRDPLSRLRMRPGRVDPYPVYDEIRRAGGAVRTPLGNLAVVDHAACREVLRSRRFGVRPEHDDGATAEDAFDLSFLERNPPDHTRLRRLAAPAFSARRIAGFETMVGATVTRLLDDVPRDGRPFDLVGRLAAPLPITVISELLGVPDVDHDAFVGYGRVIGSALGGITGLRHARDLQRSGHDLAVLFERLAAQRRADPRDDLMSELVAAVDDDRMAARELVPLCVLLLIAGFETTVNLVGNAVNALLDHPDQWALLTADPAGLAHAAVVETLRFDAPVQRTVRLSFDDTEVLGRPVRAGSAVHVLIGGANRDPAVFGRPDTFDLTRGDAGDHLAFSAGIHHCVGRPLAELEATLLLRGLAERLPGLRRAGAVVRREATLLRGPAELPVSA